MSEKPKLKPYTESEIKQHRKFITDGCKKCKISEEQIDKIIELIYEVNKKKEFRGPDRIALYTFIARHVLNNKGPWDRIFPTTTLASFRYIQRKMVELYGSKEDFDKFIAKSLGTINENELDEINDDELNFQITI